jgi:hypothetical protein
MKGRKSRMGDGKKMRLRRSMLLRVGGWWCWGRIEVYVRGAAMARGGGDGV